MAGSQADSAALLRVLMKHGRLERAAALALQYLRASQTEVKPQANVSEQLPAQWFKAFVLVNLHVRTGQWQSDA